MSRILTCGAFCLAIAASLTGINLPIAAGLPPISQIPSEAELQRRGCQYLQEVSTGQVRIRKTIRVNLGPFIRRGNLNTDFAVPTGTRFRSYIATLTPENTATYETEIYLKYPDGRSARIYEDNSRMARGRTQSLAFRPPTTEQPYQVNLQIGGRNGNAYIISVLACLSDV